MGPTLASPEEEYWAAITQWKTAGMPVDSGCTDHIVTNIDAFLDFVSIQSVVRNPNGEASRVVATGCVRLSIPSNKGEFQCYSITFFMSRTILQTSYQSQDARSGDMVRERKQLLETPEGNSGKSNTKKKTCFTYRAAF